MLPAVAHTHTHTHTACCDGGTDGRTLGLMFHLDTSECRNLSLETPVSDEHHCGSRKELFSARRSKELRLSSMSVVFPLKLLPLDNKPHPFPLQPWGA
ncbi:hypothetical protein DNTS_012308, partial [Danionella cerebrum]